MSFTPIQIGELIDGEATRTSDAVVAFQQGVMTFKGSVRPNPIHQINIINQLQLEASLLGTNLIIPAGESVIVSIDDSFSLSKPFKKQAGSSILIKSQSITNTLTYTGDIDLDGPLIQMDGAVVGGITQLDNITLSGDFANECFAVNDALFSISNTVVIQQFARVGTVTAGLVIWNVTALVSNLSGIAFIDTPTMNINMSGNGEFIPPTTLASFVSTNRMDVVIENSQYVTNDLHEFLFFDPNTDPNSSFKVRDSGILSTILSGALFQKGEEITVVGVIDDGNGKMECAAPSHLQVDNTYAVLSGFSESTYNVTSRIKVLSAGTFVALDIDFVSADNGFINRSSLDATDPRVLAEDNPDQPNSMSSAQVGFTNISTPILVTPLTIGVPILIGGTQFVSDNLERATATSGGQITNLTKATKKYPVTFSGLIEKVSGGSTDIGLLLVKNGVLDLTATFEIPHSVNAGVIQISATRDYELANGDTLDIAVVDFAGTNQIAISQANISYSVES